MFCYWMNSLPWNFIVLYLYVTQVYIIWTQEFATHTHQAIVWQHTIQASANYMYLTHKMNTKIKKVLSFLFGFTLNKHRTINKQSPFERDAERVGSNVLILLKSPILTRNQNLTLYAYLGCLRCFYETHKPSQCYSYRWAV